MSDKIYDIVILGGGPAGLTAGLYACRARMETALMEMSMPGGQVMITETVENYPGFPGGITGPELVGRMERQVKDLGLAILQEEATDVAPTVEGPTGGDPTGGDGPKGATLQAEQGGKPDSSVPGRHRVFTITAKSGKKYKTLSVIVATGAEWRMLGIEGEKKFRGRGVSYCATCDGPLFKNKEVAVVGGGDTAVKEALFLAKFASKVTLIHRRDRLRAESVLKERIAADPKCVICLESVAVEICGGSVVENIKIRNVSTGDIGEIPCRGVFIFVGLDPVCAFLKGRADLDKKGYIVTDNDMKSSLDGVFACGDVRAKALRQIVVAAGEAAQAAYSAQYYVERLKGTAYE